MEYFKAYLTIIKGSTKKEEIRKFTIDSDVAPNFLYLREKLQCIFVILRGKQFKVTWKDIEGDSITISSDEELRIALQESPEGGNHKIFITVQLDEDKNVYVYPQEGIVHNNIVCDGCNNDVRGFRYKCLECSDYDLCSRCEGKGLHPEHCMLRIVEPLQWSSRHGKRLAHHMKKFVRGNSSYSGREENVRECPAMKERHRRRHGPKCEPTSMVETLLDLLSDSSNYTGECPLRSNASKEPETATEALASCDKPKSQETDAEAHQPVDYLKYVEDTIAPVLNHFGINVSVKVKDNEKSDQKPHSAPTNQANSRGAPMKNETSDSKPNNTPVNQGDSIETPIINEKSDLKPNNAPANQAVSKGALIVNEKSNPKPNNSPTNEVDSKRIVNEKSGKSSDDDEWTIVNGEEKSLDTGTSDTVQNLPNPSNSVERTNENMPQELLTPSAPVKETTNGNLYPPLPQPTINQSIVLGSNPKIQSAVAAMIDMGFSNEDGWLTQLLIRENGNVNKVLDMLSPV